MSINKQGKMLDLRSPSTKFSLMRKLQAVKELNNSSDEEDGEFGPRNIFVNEEDSDGGGS